MKRRGNTGRPRGLSTFPVLPLSLLPLPLSYFFLNFPPFFSLPSSFLLLCRCSFHCCIHHFYTLPFLLSISSSPPLFSSLSFTSLILPPPLFPPSFPHIPQVAVNALFHKVTMAGTQETQVQGNIQFVHSNIVYLLARRHDQVYLLVKSNCTPSDADVTDQIFRKTKTKTLFAMSWSKPRYSDSFLTAR